MKFKILEKMGEKRNTGKEKKKKNKGYPYKSKVKKEEESHNVE